MHPNGQLPAYEWAFGDVIPRCTRWAAWRVYKIERPCARVAIAHSGESFSQAAVNFTWWVNPKDPEGMNIFQGGSWAWTISSVTGRRRYPRAAISNNPTAPAGWACIA